MGAGKADPRRVLVLDGDQPSSLAIVRSLGRFGLSVDTGERRRRFLASYSRHASRALSYPDPLIDPGAFVDAIERIVRADRYALVIPVTEDTVQPLAAARERIAAYAPLAVASNDALEVMTDKAKTFALAAQLGVPIPNTATCSTVEEALRAAGSLGYPLVVKPVRSISSGRSREKMQVRYAHGGSELARLVEAALRKSACVLLQERVRGVGIGIEVLADRGEIAYAFQHKRLHELPLSGGGSCLRVSVPVDPLLLEHAKKLLAAVGWHGVAMIEFKVDEASKDARLMEVNGRFWGSLPLAIAAGADFPRFLYRLETEGVRPDPIRDAPRIGVVSRKLDADIDWYLRVVRRDDVDARLVEWPALAQIAKDALLGLSPDHRYDVQSIDDVAPGLIDLARTGRRFAERSTSALRLGAITRRQRLAQWTGRVRRLAGAARRILFVCHGNINRSVVAERHLLSLIDGTCEVASAGFHKETGRPPDPTMARIARAHGLPLEGGSSRLVDALEVRRADLVLAMEVRQLARLFDEYPSAKPKAFLLGAMGPGSGPLEIADPYGGDEETYARCFREITACTRAIADTLTQRKRRG